MTVRFLPLLVVLAAAPAHADVDRAKVKPFPVTAISVGVMMHAGKLAGLTESGWGPNLELAVAGGRWQYFLEVGHQWTDLGPESTQIEGQQRRAGLGVRWLARSFELGTPRRGAVDMIFEGFVGASRFDFDGMDRIVRPDLGLGVGYVIRGFFGRQRAKQAGFRLSARVFFAPTDRATVLAACRGICPMSTQDRNSGLMAVYGGSF